ncbi:MAG: hypothetical protein KF851_00185 [Pirellulaceae bacterium]|nr:hypothetical protein [Pirellulaceae bacterium]
MSFSVVNDGVLCMLSLIGEAEAGSVGTLVVPAARSQQKGERVLGNVGWSVAGALPRVGGLDGSAVA